MLAAMTKPGTPAAPKPTKGRSTQPSVAPDAALDAAEAWKAVSLVNDWVRHAESKAAATLAAAGVTGGVLYNLVKAQTAPGLLISVAATVCAVGVVAAGAAAIAALWPRLRSNGSATNSLYFDHIARRHPTTYNTYAQELVALVASPAALLDQLAHQIWSNSRVAKRKYFWAGVGLISLVLSLAGLGAIAADLALVSVGVLNG